MKQLIPQNEIYEITNFPYSFNIMCSFRISVETRKQFGQRLVSQTYNKSQNSWNKVKSHSFADIVIVMIDKDPINTFETFKAIEINLCDYLDDDIEELIQTYYFDINQRAIINEVLLKRRSNICPVWLKEDSIVEKAEPVISTVEKKYTHEPVPAVQPTSPEQVDAWQKQKQMEAVAEARYQKAYAEQVASREQMLELATPAHRQELLAAYAKYDYDHSQRGVFKEYAGFSRIGEESQEDYYNRVRAATAKDREALLNKSLGL